MDFIIRNHNQTCAPRSSAVSALITLPRAESERLMLHASRSCGEGQSVRASHRYNNDNPVDVARLAQLRWGEWVCVSQRCTAPYRPLGQSASHFCCHGCWLLCTTCAPRAFVSFCRSDPARSTRFNPDERMRFVSPEPLTACTLSVNTCDTWTSRQPRGT